jgi:hypothetical protein
MKSQLYEKDFLRWSQEQAVLLRSGKLSDIDIENIAEEIEDLGNEQKNALCSLYRELLIHLLKYKFSPAKDQRKAWSDEIDEFRDQLVAKIEDTPSLANYANDLFARAWPRARRGAVRAFGKHGERVNLPTDCPFTLAQVTDENYLPVPTEVTTVRSL